ncbi:Myc-type, basic helix-loop-helix [Sesbania bispinosa]|nr:Myc-type, basic helix-loop-helix [Sesbania bispinosa]
MEDEIYYNQDGDSSFDEEEFLKEILQKPDFFSPESDEQLLPSPDSCCKIQNDSVEGVGVTSPSNSTLSFDETGFDGNNGSLQKSNSSNSIMSLERSCVYSPAGVGYLLSFDNSSGVEPIAPQPPKGKHNDLGLGSNKRKDGFEFEPRVVNQATKKGRRSSETKDDHIMAERKRRQELTGNIIALSATIPGLKKMDKAYVLGEAVNYVKQLQERIKELENQNRDKREDSAIFTRKKSQPNSSNNNKSTSCCETNTESSLEVEARVEEKEVLIGIHCEKQKDIVLKIHVLLAEKLHLSVTSSTVLPFGTSTLIINIVAQMGDEYRISMDELVKNLREYLLEAYSMQ